MNKYRNVQIPFLFPVFGSKHTQNFIIMQKACCKKFIAFRSFSSPNPFFGGIEAFFFVLNFPFQSFVGLNSPRKGIFSIFRMLAVSLSLAKRNFILANAASGVMSEPPTTPESAIRRPVS